jgi:UDP-N-acetyl-2-amino-2-deoxyglucuronate dehydrogenase
MDNLKKSNGERISFGLIGCGAIAAKHALAIGRLDNGLLVGAYDADPGAAQTFSNKHAVPVFGSVEEMVEKTEPDVLCVLTPSGLHGENILDAIRFNRHFVVEKPLALRMDQIDRILEECDKRQLRLFVVKQNRFNPPIRILKEAIDAGRFGKLVMGTVRVRWRRDQSYYDQKPWRGTWAQDGGVLTNQASHHIDMLIWMMGEVESVVAKTATRLVNIEAEDTGLAILKFRNGALGLVEATTAARPKDLEGSISVLGEKGTVEVGGFFMNELKVWEFGEEDPMDRDVWQKYGNVPNEPAWNHTEFFKDVIWSLLSRTRGLIDGIEGRKSVELINAIYESVETGREVSLRFAPNKCRLGGGVHNDK